MEKSLVVWSFWTVIKLENVVKSSREDIVLKSFHYFEDVFYQVINNNDEFLSYTRNCKALLLILIDNSTRQHS
jgi:hypothetical protein